MSLTIAALAGISCALFLHWFSWYTRLNHLSWAVNLGAIGAVGITLTGGLFIWPYPADIADVVLQALVLLWVFALLVGFLQARSLPALWWQGVLSVFYEAGLALLLMAGANASRPLQIFGEKLGRIRIQNIEYSSFFNAAIMIFVSALAVFAAIRPLIRLYKSRK